MPTSARRLAASPERACQLARSARWACTIVTSGRRAGTAASFVYGKLEALADKNADHYLNRAPSVISEVGRSGNVALLAWVIGVATKQPLVKAAAAGLINVAAYQYARGAGFTEKEQKFKLAGPSHRGALPEARDEVLVERFLRARAAEHGG